MMNEALQRALAEHVYEEMRKSLILVNSAMLPWPDLPADQQAQFMVSMRIWLMGIGSNEVGAEWYKRSGQMPQWFWQQLEGYETENIFVMAGVKMLFKLVELAEQAQGNFQTLAKLLEELNNTNPSKHRSAFPYTGIDRTPIINQIEQRLQGSGLRLEFDSEYDIYSIREA